MAAIQSLLLMATGNTTYESRMSDENELWVAYLNTLGSNESH
jgi:hypothetical protein